MIRYALRCPDGHTFDSWFRSADDFDRLAGTGMIGCAVCGGDGVTKAPMAPALGDEARPPAEAEQRRAAALARLRAEVEANSTWVGTRFAAEARAMHEGDKPARPIHGEARLDEARALIEDGVPVAPLPFIPRSRSN